MTTRDAKAIREDRIAKSLNAVFDIAGFSVSVWVMGEELDRQAGEALIARALNEADMIAAIEDEPCDECAHARDAHADDVGACSYPGCWCGEWWSR